MSKKWASYRFRSDLSINKSVDVRLRKLERQQIVHLVNMSMIININFSHYISKERLKFGPNSIKKGLLEKNCNYLRHSVLVIRTTTSACTYRQHIFRTSFMKQGVNKINRKQHKYDPPPLFSLFFSTKLFIKLFQNADVGTSLNEINFDTIK